MKIRIAGNFIASSFFFLFLLLFFLTPQLITQEATAALRPEKVYLAEAKKSKVYISDGLITGGDRNINEFVIKDIRRGPNIGFERVVIDLEGNQNGKMPAIQRPPYFQVAVTPELKQATITFWGKPKLSFDPKRILASKDRNSVIEKVMLLPRMEENSWTFAFQFKANAGIEVFELSNPVRMILDIQRKRQ